MFGSVTIEIAIGLIVIFILVSTICAVIREGIESILKTRAAYLEQGIRELLGSVTAKNLYEHPLIFGLFKGDYTESSGVRGKNMPSYIPSKNFARAIMDIAAKGADTDVRGEVSSTQKLTYSIRQNISNLKNPKIERVLLNALDMAQDDIDKTQANLENWYNSAMDRVSGWYKRSTQWIILIISLVVTIGLNIDSIKIMKYLSNDENARKLILEKAEKLDKNAQTEQSALSYEQAQKAMEELKLPIGWDKPSNYWSKSTDDTSTDWRRVMNSILGWLITAAAAMLGTPYWFDVLNKVMVIRSTVKPHEKSPEEGSQDR
ncbi:hypothetical protein E0W68_04000 [Flavobacterium salilacus subsp. salilacus]|uniref:hypothetical protein n=1 Tax=Flavobacterium TaxID=237 RepID=UPI0010751B98|nr:MULTISPECIES: hypothetical protein [Flavobacterium]KAF2519519.1 hypothetical protein E0W68_04000 [Flavobacterium salilacus subsp. salilacus]MBE1614583.1 hypothetical protein [Flavobacterium sp. SaA2.13]